MLYYIFCKPQVEPLALSRQFCFATFTHTFVIQYICRFCLQSAIAKCDVSYLSVSAMEMTATNRKSRLQLPPGVAAVTATRRTVPRPPRPPCKPVTSRRRPMTSCRPHFRSPPPCVDTDDVD